VHNEGTVWTLAEGGETTNELASIFKDINIPEDAENVMFDLRFESAGSSDLITLSINDKVLIYIDARSFGTSQVFQKSYAAYVGNYAGQTVRLRISLRGQDAEDSVACIDNLKFTKMTFSGDINGDKAVDVADLKLLADNWLRANCDSLENCNGADINEDGAVNLIDFAYLSSVWLNRPASIVYGDFNTDGIVGMGDLKILADHWLREDCSSTNNWCEWTDSDLSGNVNLKDFAALAENWGK